MASTLLQALLRNESGGRNIPNVHQGTSSGQAQGYFQITTGTWDEFGGRKYAENPLQATKEQQAEIASKIPLKRWDPSTVALMRATGRPIDPNRTLGENLAMNGESFADFNPGGGATNQYKLPKAQSVGGAGAYQPPAQPTSNTPANATTSPSSVTPPYGQDQPPEIAAYQPGPQLVKDPNDPARVYADSNQKSMLSAFGEGLGNIKMGGAMGAKSRGGPADAARIDAPAVPPLAPVDPNRRMMLAQLMAQLNSGRLFG